MDALGYGVCVCAGPDYCQGHKKVVCGSDGVLYPSHCELHRMACVKNKHIGIEHLGKSCAEPAEGNIIDLSIIKGPRSIKKKVLVPAIKFPRMKDPLRQWDLLPCTVVHVCSCQSANIIGHLKMHVFVFTGV